MTSETLALGLGLLLADDSAAREMAVKGWERTWSIFDSSRVLDYLLAQLFAGGGAKHFEWPVGRWV